MTNIPEEIVDQLCPTYQVFISELEGGVGLCIDGVETEIKFLLDFSSKYLMLPHYWYYILRNVPRDNEKLCNLISKKAKEQFMARVIGPKEVGGAKAKMLTFLFSGYYENPGFEFDESDLSFPHPHLNGCLYKIEMESNHFLPKELFEIYDFNKKWHLRIKAAECDFEQWVKMLSKFAGETGHDEYVRILIENQLRLNIFNVKLWKMYIEYLRVHDLQDMLQLYSKFCRFFIDDITMKKKYESEVEKYGPVYVEWNDLFEFETRMPKVKEVEEVEDLMDMSLKKFYFKKRILFFNMDDINPSPNGLGFNFNTNSKIYANLQNANEAPTKWSKFKTFQMTRQMMPSIFSSIFSNSNNDSVATDSVSAEDDPMSSENFQDSEGPLSSEIDKLSKDFFINFFSQEFPFKTPLMKYILDKVNASLLRKLHHSCKFFFHQKPFPICYRLFRNRQRQFLEDSLGLDFYDENQNIETSKICKNFIIANSLIDDFSSDDFIPSIISQIYRCDAKYIHVQCNLTPTEMKILFQSGNVIVFKWKNTHRSKKLYCPALEEVTQYLPKIEELTLLPVTVTPSTCEKLLLQKFESKIYSLKLREINGDVLNAEKFLHFIDKNKGEIFILETGFQSTFSEDPSRFLEYKEAMETYQKTAEFVSDFSILANDGIGH